MLISIILNELSCLVIKTCLGQENDRAYKCLSWEFFPIMNLISDFVYMYKYYMYLRLYCDIRHCLLVCIVQQCFGLFYKTVTLLTQLPIMININSIWCINITWLQFRCIQIPNTGYTSTRWCFCYLFIYPIADDTSTKRKYIRILRLIKYWQIERYTLCKEITSCGVLPHSSDVLHGYNIFCHLTNTSRLYCCLRVNNKKLCLCFQSKRSMLCIRRYIKDKE